MSPSKESLMLPCVGVCRIVSVETPIGTLNVAGCDGGLHSISQEETPEPQNPDPSVLVRLAMWQPEDDPIGNKPILYCFDWLRAYFEHPDKVDQAVTPDLCPASFSTHGNFTEKIDVVDPKISYNQLRGWLRYPTVLPTGFLVLKTKCRCEVWLTLRSEVPFGTTISYAQLASLSGSPRAARAVGNAMGRNPLPLVVPCHRVIKSGGQPGAYCWGKRDNVKKWLLAHEKEAFGAIVNNTSIINY